MAARSRSSISTTAASPGSSMIAPTTVSFFEHTPEVPELLKAWVRGYRRIGTLSAEEENEIATFVMLRRLLLVAWIGSHSETELAQSMGVAYTGESIPLCEKYLSKFGRLDSASAAVSHAEKGCFEPSVRLNVAVQLCKRACGLLNNSACLPVDRRNASDSLFLLNIGNFLSGTDGRRDQRIHGDGRQRRDWQETPILPCLRRPRPASSNLSSVKKATSIVFLEMPVSRPKWPVRRRCS